MSMLYMSCNIFPISCYLDDYQAEYKHSKNSIRKIRYEFSKFNSRFLRQRPMIFYRPQDCFINVDELRDELMT